MDTMNCYFSLCLLIIALCAAVPKATKANIIDAPITFNSTSHELFKQFLKTYDKIYASATEYTERYHSFKQSLDRHNVLNAGRSHPQDAFYGVTQFSDLTPKEFATSVLGHRSSKGQLRSSLNYYQQYSAKSDQSLVKDVPPQHDWRTHKPSVFSPVRDQGSCGGCWAFSVIESMETQYALKHGKLLELSPQQLIDCAGTPADHGCQGGNLFETLQWLNNSKQPVVLEKMYPYKGKNGNCKRFNSTSNTVTVSNFTHGSYHWDESPMLSMLYSHGPLSVAVDATSWQDYMGGIIQHHCYDMYDNHAVQIVGYDTTGDVPYYMVRNSWGKSWGLNGYVNIRIGNNLCGIANTVASVDVN